MHSKVPLHKFLEKAIQLPQFGDKERKFACLKLITKKETINWIL